MMTILMIIVGFVVGAYFGGDPFSGMIVFLFISILINIFSYFYSDSSSCFSLSIISIYETRVGCARYYARC